MSPDNIIICTGFTKADWNTSAMELSEHHTTAANYRSTIGSAKADMAPRTPDNYGPLGNVVIPGRPEQAHNNANARPPVDSLSRFAMVTALVVFLPVASGVFAVMAVSQSSISNEQAQTANQIALLSLCYANSVHSSPAVY